jgi:peptidoglycan hydrolase CwlO-like protein
MDIDFLKYIIGLSIVIIGYFLKDVFGRFQKLNDKVDFSISNFKEEHGKLKGRVGLIEKQIPSDIYNLEKMMEIKFDQVNEQFKSIIKAIEHSDNTIRANAEAFGLLYNEIKKISIK